MPHFMVPNKVEFVTELPKMATEKIQKVELRPRAMAFTVLDDELSTKMHQLLLDIITKFLLCLVKP